MNRYVKYGLVSLSLILIQTKLVSLVTLEGISPDLLAIWVVYIALAEGQLKGTVWGFAIGLVFDLLAGNFLGIGALSKTLCGFLGGYFFNENKTRLILGSYRFLLIVLFSSFIQNVVYFVIFTQGTDIGLARAIIQFGVTTTLYTTAVAFLPTLLFSRQGAG